MRLTDGISSVEGSAGGGLATWALIAGNETDSGIGATAHVTYVPLADYEMISGGAAVGLFDRVELSYTHQDFNTGATGMALGLGRDFRFAQDIFGVKLRLVGDAIYAQDTVLPQISIGVQHKRAAKGDVIRAVGGKQDNGTDFYVAATKLVLSKSLLLNATARMTKANHMGLLGFGGDRSNAYSMQFEGSAGWLATKRLVVGGEYRTMPDNLGFAREDDALDIFAAYAVSRHVTVTAAYVDLGSIATFDRQRGGLVSLKFGL
ncbi:MAG: DUF3034 family protein [Pseudomonadota bacterium]